jgi:hypothetical protein
MKIRCPFAFPLRRMVSDLAPNERARGQKTDTNCQDLRPILALSRNENASHSTQKFGLVMKTGALSKVRP